ncbi:hypothetical protein ACIBCR_15505 [Micromonospora echinospora]|uniref:hypothetical protein n=1 Tax=Micromonospora echinospora TaxID=1877 RepID=UPI00378BC917
MTDQTAYLPTVDSVWEGPDGSHATITEITLIHGKPNVCYESTWPGTRRVAVGVSDVNHFTATRTLLAPASG